MQLFKLLHITFILVNIYSVVYAKTTQNAQLIDLRTYQVHASLQTALLYGAANTTFLLTEGVFVSPAYGIISSPNADTISIVGMGPSKSIIDLSGLSLNLSPFKW